MRIRPTQLPSRLYLYESFRTLVDTSQKISAELVLERLDALKLHVGSRLQGLVLGFTMLVRVTQGPQTFCRFCSSKHRCYLTGSWHHRLLPDHEDSCSSYLLLPWFQINPSILPVSVEGRRNQDPGKHGERWPWLVTRSPQPQLILKRICTVGKLLLNSLDLLPNHEVYCSADKGAITIIAALG
jgi:hypothetical protein